MAPDPDSAAALVVSMAMSSRQVLPYFLGMHIGQGRHALLGLGFFLELLSPRVGGMGAAEGRVRAHRGTGG